MKSRIRIQSVKLACLFGRVVAYSEDDALALRIGLVHDDIGFVRSLLLVDSLLHGRDVLIEKISQRPSGR